ncbi:MAG: glycosyltransferase family 39 protein [Sandaracinaceae bacterium]|nr:glycosyltransferase family 39 protein [Sandaracinaceae bacterium]
MSGSAKLRASLFAAGLALAGVGATLGLLAPTESRAAFGGLVVALVGAALLYGAHLLRAGASPSPKPSLARRPAASVTAGAEADAEGLAELGATWSLRVTGIVLGIVWVAVGALTLAGLGRYGIWDPWELASADLARQVQAGEAVELTQPPLGVWLVARGFAVFGVQEWAGRLPMALAGLASAVLAFVVAARFAGRRAGVVAAVVAATSPLLLLNARTMLGAAPAFAASAAVFLCALSAVFAPASLRAPTRQRVGAQLVWLAALAVAATLATMASGVLVGVAPPLLAVAITVVARGELVPPFAERPRAAAAATILLLGLVAGGGAAWAVYADYAGFGLWTGGVPRGGDPPTWEIAIERLFHGFAPWSGLLPVALAAMFARAPRPPGARVRHPEENALRLAVVAWVGLGYLAQTVFSARFGPATFVPLVGAAIAIALFLEDVARTPRSRWGAGVVTLLLVGLVLRDYRAYPGGPVAGLAVDGLSVPDEFNPASRWAIVLGLFALTAFAALGADPSSEHAVLRRDFAWIRDRWRAGGSDRALAVVGALRIGVPVERVREQWARGPGFRIWLVTLGALLPLTFVALGLAALVAGEWLALVTGSSLAVRIVRAAALVPVAVVLAIAAARLALFGLARLRAYRVVPIVLAGLAVGGYTAHGFQPALSSHFSPREVYDTYNALAAAGEPLAEFRVGGRAAAYYVREGQPLEEVDSQAALVDRLLSERRVWAAFRADDLAAINREYRRRAGRHLFVADARSARMLLATNQPVEGRENENYLAEAVLDEPPANIQHPIRIDFDRRIVLLGYDLDLPHGTYVGPGEAFTITWYFQVVAPVSGSYAPFVHMDGSGQRLNGDHEPVGGRYPVRLWEAGDVVVDRQEIRVPANYGRGNLTIYVGFWAGDNRLDVVDGPADEVNRARVGVLPVR